MANFEEVIESEIGKLRSLAAYLLPNGNAVDDVVQLTVIRAHEQWPDLKDGTDPGPWLRTILRYMVKTELKHLKRDGEKKNRYRCQWFEILEKGMINPDPEQDFDPHTALEHCQQALAPTAHELITLKYEQNVSCKDIAEQKQKSISWVTTTLSRVRQTLKQCIHSRKQEAEK
jgi:RNA polymerase sigma factor (sigma-70 family)